MADGYPIEAQLADTIERQKGEHQEVAVLARRLPHPPGRAREAPRAGEIFRQPDLAATLRKLVEAERQALAAGKSRKEAIYAAYDRFYKGDIARGDRARHAGAGRALHHARTWPTGRCSIEEPVKTNYKGIDVYKLNAWTQGPAMLQALNILENLDLRGMGYNSARYIHTLYQAMSLAFADRDFYYGDPYFPPDEPLQALLSKEYANDRREADRLASGTIRRSSPAIPTRSRAKHEPLSRPAEELGSAGGQDRSGRSRRIPKLERFDESFRAGTTSVDRRRRGGVGGLGDAERRLGARPSSPAAPASASRSACRASCSTRPKARSTCWRPASGRG